jgi:uncharacterized integral membrane protein
VFRKIVSAIIIVPLAAVIIAFAVANRQAVTVSFDPFSSTSPAYAATLPLFAVIFAALILGVLIGGVATWIGQGKWRRRARKRDAELRALQQEIDLRNAREVYRSHPQPPAEQPPPIVPPSIP